jgi:hypothetical protein
MGKAALLAAFLGPAGHEESGPATSDSFPTVSRSSSHPAAVRRMPLASIKGGF